MTLKRNLTGKQLGNKVKYLFHLIEITPNWENYVSVKTRQIVKLLYKNKNMIQTLDELDMKYTTVRAYLMKAIDRIENKKLDYLRDGQSWQAKRLFKLMELPDWKNNLTDQEILLAEEFHKHRNFYEVGRTLNLVPGNVAATLYGNTQKLGVVYKIERQLKAAK